MIDINGAGSMHKYDLILIHLVLFKIKQMLEASGKSFESYENLGIFPTSINKSKQEHIRAVRILCREILNGIGENPERAIQKFKEMHYERGHEGIAEEVRIA
jgi:hypothetical protein